jgi:hypothetical protein
VITVYNEEVPSYDVFISYHKETELKHAREIKRKLAQNSFCWDNVSEKENDELKNFLRKEFDMDWVKVAGITKSNDDMTIYISTDKHSAEIRMDANKKNATLKIRDGKTHNLEVKKVDDKQYIYSQSEAEIKCFIDDEDMIPGMHGVKNIKGAIRNSMSMLVLYNKEAVNSGPIITEINIACEFNEERVSKREIIIFKERDVPKTNLPECVKDNNYVKFDINKPDYLINRVLEMSWEKNPNTIESIHTSYEDAKNYQLLNSQLTSTEFLMGLKNRLPKKSSLDNFLSRLKSIITKMLDKNIITMPEEYEELKRDMGDDMALYILSVVTLKEGIHKGIF